MVHTLDFLFASIRAMAVVTSWPLCDTPCAVTPLSAQNTSTHFFGMSISALP